jgi:hypothetical protein
MPKDQVDQLEDIKKLLVLQLLNSGVTAGALATLLGLDPGDFSRLYPVRRLLKKGKE